jgi:hypothetical protein
LVLIRTIGAVLSGIQTPQNKRIKRLLQIGVHSPKETTYFKPSEKPFMFHYRVHDLVALLALLKTERVTVIGDIQEFDYRKFGPIRDNDGNKIALW